MNLSPRTIYRIVAAIIAAYVLAGCVAQATAAPAPSPYRSGHHARTATVSGTEYTADYQYRYTADPDQALTAHWYTGRTAAPAVILIHGGSWINGTRANAQPMADVYYAHGWQTFNVDYRRGDGVTVQQQEDDILAARNWIVAHATTFHVDPTKLSAYGFSAGGHLATTLGNTGTVSAVVSLSGVLQPQRVALAAQSGTAPAPTVNLNIREETMMGCAFPGTWAGTDPCTEAWRAFCPEFAITPNSAPEWIGQGDADQVVPYQTAAAYGYWLGQQGVRRTVTVFSGYGHTEDYVLTDPTEQSRMLGWVLAQ